MSRSQDQGGLLQIEGLRRLFPIRRGLTEMLTRRQHAVHAVDEISFSLEPGEILGLVGESGCGKSTLGRLIVRLDQPTTGDIRFEGQDVTALEGDALKEFRRKAQIIFQNPFESFDSRQTIGGALHEALRIHQLGSPEDRQKQIVAALEAAGIVPAADFLNRFPHELSGGQLQRIATVRAMLLGPDLLIADEPVSMLDVSVRADILNQLLDLRESHRMAIIFITHDIAVARYIADRIAVMYLGTFVEIGPVDEVINEPTHPYTQALLSHTLPVGDERAGTPITISGDPPAPVDLGVGCRFADRCPFAFDRCRTETPKLQPLGDGRQVACHLIDLRGESRRKAGVATG